MAFMRALSTLFSQAKATLMEPNAYSPPVISSTRTRTNKKPNDSEANAAGYQVALSGLYIHCSQRISIYSPLQRKALGQDKTPFRGDRD